MGWPCGPQAYETELTPLMAEWRLPGRALLVIAHTSKHHGSLARESQDCESARLIYLEQYSNYTA